MNPIPNIVLPVLKVNHALAVPWILITVPAGALFHQELLLLPILVSVGLVGMLARKRALATATSVSLLIIVVWGKIASDLYGLAREDTALLLLQFMIIIFLMEASDLAVTTDATLSRLKGKNDDISTETRAHLNRSTGTQLLNLGKFVMASFGLSVGLLILGGLVNVSVNQLAFSGVLVLAAVVAILVLLVYNREPEQRKASTV